MHDGSYPWVCQLIHRRVKRLLYTRLRFYPDEFDKTSGEVLHKPDGRFSPAQVRHMNRQIEKMRRGLQTVVLALQAAGQDYTVDDVVNRYRLMDGGIGLLDCLDRQIRHKRSLGRWGMAQALLNTRVSLAAYMGGREVSLSEVDAAFVRGYEEFLQARGIRRNTVCYYLRNFRSLYNWACSNGWTSPQGNPFIQVHARPCRTVKRALPLEGLRRIRNEDFSAAPHLDLARDLFLFSFYSRGMSFVDVIYLKKSDVWQDIISYRRHKTGQQLQVALTPQLRALMQKYGNESPFVFPILQGTDLCQQHREYRRALERVNHNLKQVGRVCGSPITLTTYCARHSWATRAKELGVPVSVISESLGHTSERTTRIYLKEFENRVVDEVNEKVTLL